MASVASGVLAQGSRPGWYLLDAGTETDGTHLACVLDAVAAVIYPAYRIDRSTGRAWRHFDGDPGPVLAAAETATKAVPAPVIARNGDRYLLHAGIDGYGLDLGRVLDAAAGKLYSASGVESTLKHGYWDAFDGDPGPILAAATHAERVEIPDRDQPGPRRPPMRITTDEVVARLSNRGLHIPDQIFGPQSCP